jgi:hypothetical protein
MDIALTGPPTHAPKRFTLPAEYEWKTTALGEDVIPEMRDRFHTRSEFPSQDALSSMPDDLREEWNLRREFHIRWFQSRPRAVVTPFGLRKDGRKFASGRGIRGDIQGLLNESGHLKTWTSNKLSAGSRENFNYSVHAFYSRLRTLNFRLQFCWSLNLIHVKALIRDWLMSPTPERRVSVDTAENLLSHLRKWLVIIGKDELKLRLDELFEEIPAYLRRKKSSGIANRTPEAVGLTGEGVVAIALQENRTFAMILLLELQFGLRREEGLKFRQKFIEPGGIKLSGRVAGTKGARDRFIPFQTAEQALIAQNAGHLTDLEVIAIYKCFVAETKRKSTESLGWSAGAGGTKANLKKDLNRYEYLARKCGFTKNERGVTPHGQRHAFAINRLLAMGFVSPFLSESKRFEKIKAQLPLAFVESPGEHKLETEVVGSRDPDLRAAMREVSESLGHSRLSVVHTYVGNPIVATISIAAESPRNDDSTQIPSVL